MPAVVLLLMFVPFTGGTLEVSRLVGPAAYDVDDTVDHPAPTWALERYGPITALELCKAWFYDGAWHDPGELKGVRTWYGNRTDDRSLLLGARVPHVCLTVPLKPGEGVVSVSVGYDAAVFRWASFLTTRGSRYAWGFFGTGNNTTTVVLQPRASSPPRVLAALYGREGRPLPGVARKRYIARIGAVWMSTG